MPARRRDLIEYFEENSFYLLREVASIRSTRITRRQFQSKGIAP